MKIVFIQPDIMAQMSRDCRTDAFLTDVENCMDELYGTRDYNGPVIFNAAGHAMKRTLPKSVLDKREPWVNFRIKNQNGAVGYALTKGEADDDA